jgi:hypothetical protein
MDLSILDKGRVRCGLRPRIDCGSSTRGESTGIAEPSGPGSDDDVRGGQVHGIGDNFQPIRKIHHPGHLQLTWSADPSHNKFTAPTRSRYFQTFPMFRLESPRILPRALSPSQHWMIAGLPSLSNMSYQTRCNYSGVKYRPPTAAGLKLRYCNAIFDAVCTTSHCFQGPNNNKLYSMSVPPQRV